ncbi:unnamed protein product [Aspergillus oryzae]|nr:unnamed protein product [Aspergillus oryzae]
MSTFTNPIIPGFYSDPSCIRVGDVFYMANSSFQFFPGIPIHKSKDLINWELIGNAINRPSQISLNQATTKINNASRREVFTGGIYAPTIRYHNGVFYIVCTNLTGTANMPSNTDFHSSNFIISAIDLSDPNSYSELIYFDLHGINLSLFFDKNGKVYVQGSWIYGYDQNPATVIRQAEVDVATGQLLTGARDIWSGATGKVPGGPHVYYKDGWYYLLIAEGGTHARHKITMARSRRWEMVVCDAREAGVWGFLSAGETFLTSVEWVDGEFPVFKDVKIKQRTKRQVARKTDTKGPVGVHLKSPATLYLRTPLLENYRQDGDEIVLTATDAGFGSPDGTMTFVGRRQTSLGSAASVTIILSSATSENVSYGLALYKDVFRYAAIQYKVHDSTLAVVV